MPKASKNDPTCDSKEANTPQPQAANDTDQPESFDVILRQLQSIVERLEDDDLALEESIKVFEQGMKLSKRGQLILDSAERRVEILLGDSTTASFKAD